MLLVLWLKSALGCQHSSQETKCTQLKQHQVLTPRLVTADSLHLIPGSLSFTKAAALPTPYLTAFRGLIQRGRASDTVLIHRASGGVRVAAVQFGRAYGMTVFGTAGTDRGLNIV